MKGILTVLFLVGLTSNAIAAPIYLQCAIVVDEGKAGFTVTLNEETTKIDHQYDAGALIQTDGVFTADAVTYENSTPMSQIGYLLTKFRIDRVNLSVHRISALVITNPVLKDQPAKEPVVNSGTCKVIEVPKRQF
jgi:hypothetical protein